MKKKFISTIGIFLAFAMVVPMSIVRAERDSEQNRDHDESVSNSNDDGDWDSESEDMDDDGDGMVATGTPVTAPTKDTKSKDDDDSNSQGDSHRSAVATFVQDLKNSADKIKTKSIGDEVRDIATGQEKSIDAIAKLLASLKVVAASFVFLLVQIQIVSIALKPNSLALTHALIASRKSQQQLQIPMLKLHSTKKLLISKVSEQNLDKSQTVMNQQKACLAGS